MVIQTCVCTQHKNMQLRQSQLGMISEMRVRINPYRRIFAFRHNVYMYAAINSIDSPSNAGQPRNNPTPFRIFIVSAIGILCVTAVAKVTTLSSDAMSASLVSPNPIFPHLSNAHTLFAAVVLELSVAVILLGRASDFLKMSILAWLSSLFLFYRIALHFSGYNGSCGCLGTQLELLRVPAVIQNAFTLTLIVYLASGAVYFLFESVKKRK